jgi:hypothetical protein
LHITSEYSPPAAETAPPPSAKPIINVYELSFGTVAGICTGVFVKKGLKTVAFFLGGIFFVIQVGIIIAKA